jgi:hypothetical protein
LFNKSFLNDMISQFTQRFQKNILIFIQRIQRFKDKICLIRTFVEFFFYCFDKLIDDVNVREIDFTNTTKRWDQILFIDEVVIKIKRDLI